MGFFDSIWETIAANPTHLQIIVATCLGGLIGLERELSGKDPSLRTFALISMGSCLFSIVSVQSVHGGLGDPSRIAAQIVTGVGFLGAGTIFKLERGIAGLTTAALIWVTAAIGMAVGFGFMDLAVTSTLSALGIMYVFRFFHMILRHVRKDES